MTGRNRWYALVVIGVVVAVASVVRFIGGGSTAAAPAPANTPAVTSTSPAPASTPAADPTSSTPAPVDPTTAAAVPSRTPARPAPTYRADTPVRWSDPHDVAAHWAAASCTFNWRQKPDQLLATQTVYTTTKFGASLRRSLTASWAGTVTRLQQTSTCRVTAVTTIGEAPNSPTRAYLRVFTAETRTAAGHTGPAVAGLYPLQVARVDERWLVDGYSDGG